VISAAFGVISVEFLSPSVQLFCIYCVLVTINSGHGVNLLSINGLWFYTFEREISQKKPSWESLFVMWRKSILLQDASPCLGWIACSNFNYYCRVWLRMQREQCVCIL